MGKSADQIKKRTKETPKSSISPIWIGQFPPVISPLYCSRVCPLVSSYHGRGGSRFSRPRWARRARLFLSFLPCHLPI